MTNLIFFEDREPLENEDHRNKFEALCSCASAIFSKAAISIEIIDNSATFLFDNRESVKRYLNDLLTDDIETLFPVTQMFISFVNDNTLNIIVKQGDNFVLLHEPTVSVDSDNIVTFDCTVSSIDDFDYNEELYDMILNFKANEEMSEDDLLYSAVSAVKELYNADVEETIDAKHHNKKKHDKTKAKKKTAMAKASRKKNRRKK